MSAVVTGQISSLLDKMDSNDRDLRFMAINDLINLLEKPANTDNDSRNNGSSMNSQGPPVATVIDSTLYAKMIDKCVKCVKDKTGDVQSQSIKFLVVLVTYMKEQSLFDRIFIPLVRDIETCEEMSRDAVITALKSSVKEAIKHPVSEDTKLLTVLKSILPMLKGYVESEKFSHSYNFKVDILDIIILIIRKIDACSEVNSLLSLFFNLLENGKLSMRKLAIVAIGASCESISQETFDDLVDRIYQLILSTSLPESLRIYVCSIVAICKQNPRLFGDKVETFINLFLKLIEEQDDDELKESIITAFDVFVSRCVRQMTPFVDDISQLCIKYIKHDPNYHHDTNGDNMEVESDDELSEESEEDYSDDEDYSWKVRKASTRCITTICSCNKEGLAENISKFLPILISRIKEREESVRVEIFNSLVNIFNNIHISLSPDLVLYLQSDTTKHKIYYSIDFSKLDQNEEQIVKQCCERIESLVGNIIRFLRTRHIKTKQACFLLLKTLLVAIPGSLSVYLKDLIVAGTNVLSEKNVDMNFKVEVLTFITTGMQYSTLDSIALTFDTLMPFLASVINDGYFKVISEVIMVSSYIIEALSLMKQTNNDYVKTQEFINNVNRIGEYIFQILKINALDHEIKEKVLRASGVLVATLGDLIENITNEILQYYIDNLNNDSSKLIILESLTIIIESTIKVDLLPFLPKTLVHTADFLKKNDRNLKIATLNFLVPLTGRFKNNGMQGQGLINTVRRIPELISDSDFLISRLAFKFMTGAISYYPDQISEGLDSLIQAYVQKSKSSLMQGQTVTAALNMISAIVKAPLANKPSNESLLSAVSMAVYNETLNKQALFTISKTVATILKANGSVEYAASVMNTLAGHLNNTNCEPQIQQFVILTYGEVGRLFPEVFYSPIIARKPDDILLGALESSNEEVKNSASISIGHYVIGNISKSLDFLFSSLEKYKNKQYLLLHSLKEVITSKEMNDKTVLAFRSKIPIIWDVLTDHSKCGEEGTRNVVAECMGRLAVIIPSEFIPKLIDLGNTGVPEMITTSMTAVRFILSFKNINIDEFLLPVFEDILEKLQHHPDTSVKRHAILTFNAAVNNRCRIVKPFLSRLLPLLYAETDVDESFIETIEMGPFKHKIDKRIDIRKATFECMYALANNCIDSINVFEFLSYFEKGLSDEHEIKMLAYLMIIRFINLCPTELKQRIQFFAPMIRNEIQFKIKDSASDAEKLKDEEIKKCALRAVHALRTASGFENCKIIEDIRKIILENQILVNMYESVTKETGQNVYISESTMETD
uniref:TIP120 domain-containing protein n=1 Tax=Strongyloides papillosus TaxID=174720 RepID=A0A0N5C0K3_STREA